MSSLRKIDLMHQLFGKTPRKICVLCSNFVRDRYHNRYLRKCEVYGLTHSEASDWAGRWQACGMFDKEYAGTPVIELKRHSKRPTPDIPIDGQIRLEEQV